MFRRNPGPDKIFYFLWPVGRQANGEGAGTGDRSLFVLHSRVACGTKALSIQVMSRADIGTPVYGCIFVSLPCA